MAKQEAVFDYDYEEIEARYNRRRKKALGLASGLLVLAGVLGFLGKSENKDYTKASKCVGLGGVISLMVAGGYSHARNNIRREYMSA